MGVGRGWASWRVADYCQQAHIPLRTSQPWIGGGWTAWMDTFRNSLLACKSPEQVCPMSRFCDSAARLGWGGLVCLSSLQDAHGPCSECRRHHPEATPAGHLDTVLSVAAPAALLFLLRPPPQVSSSSGRLLHARVSAGLSHVGMWYAPYL